MPQDDDGAGAGLQWVRRWWRPLLGELLATLLLVLLGVATLLPGGGLTVPALGFGFVVMALVATFHNVSGAHMNPSVTVGALILGRIPPAAAAAYCVAQLIGGAIGGVALMSLGGPLVTPGAGCNRPHHLTPIATAVTEAILTGLLVLLAAALWHAHDDNKPDHTVPIKFGLAVSALVYAGGELSGTSLNPARSLGPALYHNVWDSHWVYWVGPVGGGAVAAALWRWVLQPPPPRRARAPESLPLTDKQ